jgi:hypothetical protein
MIKKTLLGTIVAAAMAVGTMQTYAANLLTDTWTGTNTTSDTWQFYGSSDVTGTTSIGTTLLPSYTTSMYGATGLSGWYQSSAASSSNDAMVGKVVSGPTGSFTGPAGWGFSNIAQGTILMAPGAWNYSNGAGIGYLASASGSFDVNITISNLGSGSYVYRLDKIASGGAFTNITTNQMGVGLGGATSATLNYVEGNALSLNTGDRLVLSVGENWSAGGYYPMLSVNAFTVNAIPEPTTFVMMLSGLGGLLLFRRRR